MMRRVIKGDLFFVVTFHIIALSIEVLLLETTKTQTEVWSKVAGTATLLNLTIEVIYLKRSKRLLSIGSIFIILSYLFQCSFAVLLMFNGIRSDDRFYTLFIPRYGMDTFITGVNVAICFIGACFVGYVIGREKFEKRTIRKIYRVDTNSIFN